MRLTIKLKLATALGVIIVPLVTQAAGGFALCLAAAGPASHDCKFERY